MVRSDVSRVRRTVDPRSGDLKGKLVGTDRPGTPGDYYIRVALTPRF
jgi:hypothetical protein